jgi:serine phosphatase RsbU (regulator of sigma subunit)
MQIESILRQVPLFASLESDEISILAQCVNPVSLEPGEILFNENEPGSSLFIIIEGELDVIKSLGTQEERILQMGGPGNFIGEMSMFDRQGLRVAAARARTPVRLLEMSHTNLSALLHRQPDLAFEVLRILSLRLRDTDNAIISDLQEKNRQLAQAYAELKEAQDQIIEKERLERELQVARQIQKSILPDRLPQPTSFDLGALMKPARAVGGDLYDVIPLRGDKIAIVLGDVSDKGVPAAIFMALTSSLIRAESHHNVPPAKVLQNVNRHLLGMNAYGLFVTLVYGILDCRERTFTYVRAGHEIPLFFAPDGKAIHLEPGQGQALGLLDTVELEEQTLSIPPGGCLVLFSDGATDAVNPQGERFLHERLNQSAIAHRAIPAQERCEQILQDIETFQGTASQADDIALVLICGK